MLKRSLSSSMTSPDIDDLYNRAMSLGALGGKLCGAGGGGFLLMLVPPEKRQNFIENIAPARAVSIGLDTQGSTIIYS
jgi:D-glycero-alpha-D-manno-heptose-7-phosphate kinase